MQIDFQRVFQTLIQRRLWIIVPTLAFTSCAVVYALFKQDYWSASQALYIRDESVGQLTPLGRFESIDSMQTAQETIYELSQHPSVLRQAMLDVGPRKASWSKKKRAAWPSARNVDDFRGTVSVKAPRGAQFGRTELIYLSVKAESPKRAVALTDAMSDRLIERMKVLRQQKYKGIVDELARSATIARAELEKAISKLEQLDRKMGSDVVEMRVMNNSSMGDGTLRRSLSEIRTELRRAQGDYDRQKMERDQLYALRNDPGKLISLPSALLDAQPTLQGLKRGLADAQMIVARLSSEMSGDHPRVRAATLAEQKLRQRLFAELKNSVKNIDGELSMSRAKVTALAKQLQGYENKFATLSDLRTTYSRLTKEVEQRENFIEKVETDLAIARSNMAAATAASTIQRIDQPVCGVQPIGPGAKSICLFGLVGGLLTGLGLIWLIEPVSDTTNRYGADSRSVQSGPTKRTAAGYPIERRHDARSGRRASDWMDTVWPGGVPNGDGGRTVSPVERTMATPHQPVRTTSPARKQPLGNTPSGSRPGEKGTHRSQALSKTTAPPCLPTAKQPSPVSPRPKPLARPIQKQPPQIRPKRRGPTKP